MDSYNSAIFSLHKYCEQQQVDQLLFPWEELSCFFILAIYQKKKNLLGHSSLSFTYALGYIYLSNAAHLNHFQD